MRFIKLIAIIATLLLTLSSCGQRGPLYLPTEQPSENSPEDEEASANKPDEGKSNVKPAESATLDLE